MSQFIKTLSIFLISLSLLISNLNFKLSIKLEAKNNEPATSKKILKKRLSLDYTHPKFETDLNQDQKTAILKSLKKWKVELPIDNQFTVTSIANLKSNTNDESKQFKKKNKNISDALVVYMLSQSSNPSYDPKNPGESEEGDSRFIRTEFNVLLKQNKNGNWKASLERDSESKAESLDIIESDIDAQIYKDLFATDITDNAFTATEEVLIEDANTAPETSSKSNNTISILSVSSIEVSISSSQTMSSQIVPIISPAENSPQPVPKEKTSWLQSILGFSSVKASASISEYSWPWANGETWEVTNGWHECQTVNSATPNIVNFVGEIKGCSLDISQKNTGASNIVKAPITSTVVRACEDPDQSVLNFGNKVSITHVKTNSLLFNTGAFVRKADNVGIVFDPTIYPKSDPKWIYEGFPGFGTYWFKTNCGKTGGPHIHLKFSAITDPNSTAPSIQSELDSRNLVGSINIDGIIMQGPKLLPLRADGKQNYNPETIGITTTTKLITSQNLPNTNTFTGKIKSYTNNNLVFDIKDFNGGASAPVQLFTYSLNNTENQQWSYNSTTKQIKGMNGRCLTVNSADKIPKMQDCTTSTSQQWTFDNSNRILNVGYNQCVDAPSGIADFAILVLNVCGASINQKFEVSTLGVYIPNTNLYNGYIKYTTNNDFTMSILPLSNGSNNAPIVLNSLNYLNTTINQRWGYEDTTKEIKGMNGRCLDANNPGSTSNFWLIVKDCNGSNGQKWLLDSLNRIHPSSNSNLCLGNQQGVAGNPDNINVISETCTPSNNWYFTNFIMPVSTTTQIPQLNLKVNLTGPWNSTTKLMNQDLKTNNKIPLSQPYNTSPWNYAGLESVPNLASINANAVDWVLVEIKNNSNVTVLKKAGLLLKDGKVVDATTGSYLTMTGVTPNYYKIIVRHRNHLAIATDNNIYLGEYSAANVDLTKNVNVKGSNQKSLGTNSSGQTVYGLRVGDVNSDGNIDATDRGLINGADEFINLYDNKDLNLDTGLDALDRSIMLGAQEAQENL